MPHLTYADQVCTDFVDDRRQRDGVWEARIYSSYTRQDGSPHRRSDWLTYDQLWVVTHQVRFQALPNVNDELAIQVALKRAGLIELRPTKTGQQRWRRPGH